MIFFNSPSPLLLQSHVQQLHVSCKSYHFRDVSALSFEPLSSFSTISITIPCTVSPVAHPLSVTSIHVYVRPMLLDTPVVLDSHVASSLTLRTGILTPTVMILQPVSSAASTPSALPRSSRSCNYHTILRCSCTSRLRRFPGLLMRVFAAAIFIGFTHLLQLKRGNRCVHQRGQHCQQAVH